MVFGLAVYRLLDRDFAVSPPPATEVAAFAEWTDECDRRCVFSAPLGAVVSIARYWSEPADRLGLTTMSRFATLFDEALEVDGETLGDLLEEITILERLWVETVADDDMVTYKIGGRSLQVPVLVDLIQRSASLVAAIRIAEHVDGFVIIS